MSNEQSIIDHLTKRLISGEFEPGSRLRAEPLRQEYEVSASTIREILFRLSIVGLVDFVEQKGFRVPKQSPDLQYDLTRMRLMLECEGATLSIENGDVAWEARLNAAHHELKHIEVRIRDSEDAAKYLDIWAAAELKFHRTLIEKCGSPLLLDTHMQVYNRFRQQLIISDQDFKYIPINVDQHQAILDAVLEHDADLTRQRIREHLGRHLSPEEALDIAV